MSSAIRKIPTIHGAVPASLHSQATAADICFVSLRKCPTRHSVGANPRWKSGQLAAGTAAAPVGGIFHNNIPIHNVWGPGHLAITPPNVMSRTLPLL